MTVGPHVAPADLERMVALERRRDAALDADAEVVRLRAELLERLDRLDQARYLYDAASYELGRATARVLGS